MSASDWYDTIEPEIRHIVKLLRDNGFNTECSCGHEMYVQIQPVHEGFIQQLDYCLFNAGHRDYHLQLDVTREQGFLSQTLTVTFERKPR